MIALAASMVVSQAVPPVKPYVRALPALDRGHLKGPFVLELLRKPLAAVVYMEASDQGEAGQRAVAHVTVNRLKSDKRMFCRGSLINVVTCPKQYSALNMHKGRPDNQRLRYFHMLTLPETSPDKITYRRIEKITANAYYGRDKDNTGGATFYATVSCNPYWRYDMTVTGQIKDHVFFRPKTAAEAAAYRRDQAANRKLAKARRVARLANRRRKVALTIRHRVIQAGHSGRASSSFRSAPQATKHGARHSR